MGAISQGNPSDARHLTVRKEGPMSHFTRRTWKMALMSIAVAPLLSLVLQAAVPTGWHLAGSKPAEYEAGVDASAMYNERSSAYLKSKTAVADGFGTLMQDFSAEKYAGKRIRFSANVKAEEVQSWAGLWMRVDKQSTSVAFDNMQNRRIKGTTGWQNYAVTLDVPQDATAIYFGVLLEGSGAVWLNGVKVEVVGSDIPTTDAGTARLPEEPSNLDFTEP
jgi:hypothetical protein